MSAPVREPAQYPRPANRRGELADEVWAQPDRVMRIAEYAPFPRFSRHQRKRLGFTSDTAEPVLRVTVRDREKPGTLLRVVVRGIDGRPQLDTLARVAWCEEKGSCHLSLGLAVLDGDHRRAHLVRHTEEDRGRAVSM
jgi:hypothetical protein